MYDDFLDIIKHKWKYIYFKFTFSKSVFKNKHALFMFVDLNIYSKTLNHKLSIWKVCQMI